MVHPTPRTQGNAISQVKGPCGEGPSLTEKRIPFSQIGSFLLIRKLYRNQVH